MLSFRSLLFFTQQCMTRDGKMDQLPPPGQRLEDGVEAKRREVAQAETKNGLPVLSAKTYKRLYDTDVREAGENATATFNFQGYVRFEAPEYASGVFYRDSMATNG